MHDNGDSVDFSLKVAEKRVRNAGCDGGEQRDYQRKWVGLEARTEYDECADNGQCQRRDLDRESFSFINTAASSVTKIGESLFNTVTSPCAAWLEA